MASALLVWSGGMTWPIVIYMASMGVITIVSVYLAAETNRVRLDS